MDLRRFLDLYVAETGEHVRLLHRSLLLLEKDPAGGAVHEAFRAAHTIKGLSAAMGYQAVADLAHVLEDRLDELRAGRLAADPPLMDGLLAQVDALEAAIDAAGRIAPGGAPDAGPGATSAAATVQARLPSSAAPEGTAAVAVVRLRADTPIKSARAMIVMRSLEALGGVLGSEPTAFDDDFDGTFLVFLAASADTAAARALIAGAGEVESVEFTEGSELRSAATRVPAPHAPPAERQIRVDADRLDGLADGIGELAVLIGRLEAGAEGRETDREMLTRAGAVLAMLQHEVLQLRMVPLREAFERLPRVVRDAARSVGREVELVIAGDDVELDRAIIEEIGEPLVHLLRNAVDHGVEPPAQRLAAGKPAAGCIRLSAERERSSVRITLSDDGQGVDRDRVAARARSRGLLDPGGAHTPGDEELFRLLSHAGFSTADRVSAVSGRGVGLDVVASRVRALGGAIDMQTRAGKGTEFSIRLPITLAMAQALRVRLGEEHYAIPLTHIAEAVDLNGNVDEIGNSVLLRDERVPLVRLREVLHVAAAGREETAIVAVRGERRAALVVDELVGREQILVKGFDAVAGTLPYFSGATLLADGRPALVLDPLSVI